MLTTKHGCNVKTMQHDLKLLRYQCVFKVVGTETGKFSSTVQKRTGCTKPARIKQMTTYPEFWNIPLCQNPVESFDSSWDIYVTLDHKTSHKCQFFEIEMSTSSES